MKVESNEGRSEEEDKPEIVSGGKAEVAGRCTAWFCWMLGVAMLIGVGLRVVYIDHRSYNPDEQTAQAELRYLHFPDQWDTNWAKSDVIPVWRYNQYNFSSYHYILYGWKSLLTLLRIDWVNIPGALRTLNGLLGLLFIGFIAVATRLLVGEIAGIAAAFSGAVMPLLVQDAHYLRCESMLTAGVAVLLCIATSRDLRSSWMLFFSGLIVGWLAASKFTMVLVLPLVLPLLITGWMAQSQAKSRLFYLSCVVVLGVMAGFSMGVPYGVAQPRVFLSGVAKLSQEYKSALPPYTSPDMAPSFPAALAYFRGTLGWGFGAVLAIGLWKMLRRSEWWRTALILVPLVASAFVFGSHAFFTERSYSPVLPIVVLFYGAGCQCIVTSMIRFRPAFFGLVHPSVLLFLLLGVTLALPAIYTYRIDFQGFSGREFAGQIAYIDRMRSQTESRVILLAGSLFGAKENREIENAVVNKEPLLIIVSDDCDAFTPRCLAVLQSKYHGQILGVRESLFPDLPPCTLHTFISPRLWGIAIPAK